MTHISDHAIVRYLERVKGVDIAAIRAEMMTPALDKAVAFGSPVLIGKNGERLVIKNGIVTTVIGKARYAGKTISR